VTASCRTLETTVTEPTVLILGGGINGAAAARELALNGVNICLVERADLSFGATAYSSRLIHGGLRYLEYGDLALVKESLAERTRLLRLAPHQVHPLRLFIPVKSRWSGIPQAAKRFFGWRAKSSPTGRGLALVRMGLWMYDTYARDKSLPRRSVHRPGDPGTPPVSSASGHWLCAYSDAQVTFPERLVISLLRDAQAIAAERGTTFQLLTYHEASLAASGTVEVRPVDGAGGSSSRIISLTMQPAAIVNATGAWVDRTLAGLPVESRRLMGGTKGTHFFTWNPSLREMLGGNGVYAEADDGRPVFLLPLAGGTLVGTTDLPFSGDPATAVASPDELDYLVAVAHSLFPKAGITRDSIAWHYSGVRPLPYTDSSTPAAITRRHQLVWNDKATIPLVSLVGGKLTTCRSLAEESAAAVLGRLGRQVKENSRERPIPDIPLPLVSNAKAAIELEWATTLEDLVERRLMLLYNRNFTEQSLYELAAALVAAGKLTSEQVPAAIARCRERLAKHFGLQLSSA
jgi:glycerol-3-phosphate dehydrogenase